ncbi:ABC transporter ATP-binding protein [Candidatus Odyssella acanthamoebae]|uniref:ABC transporter ATP-binding protein n=1 Tax=Candidatus Odyssella acanthamoebae TaxID=91604 RepID=UPI00068C6A96|nr:ABC transporter ATP-binding protein [Candidatus Paracaedibacter acanthamoebae]
MSSPSILSALKKLRLLLSRPEKIKALWIAIFAVISSFFEVITASLIVVFAQVLSQPEIGVTYLHKVGMTTELSHSRTILYFAVAVGGIYCVKNSFAAIEIFFQNFSIQRMCYNFKTKLLNKYIEADYGFYLTRNSSLGVQVVGSDTELMFSSGTSAIASIASESIVFCILISLIVYINPALAVIIFALASLIGLLLTKVILPKFYKFGQQLQQASLIGFQTLFQFFHAFKEIILLGKREQFIKAYDTQAFKKAQVQALQTSFNALPRIIIEVMFVGLFVVAIAILALEHDRPSQMMGVLGGYLYAGFRLMPGLNRIINQLNLFKSSIPSIERVYNEYTTIAQSQNYKNIPTFHFNKTITFKDVSFKYLNTKNNALQNINFEIKKGECIGIVGETGSGKSTVVDTLLGLLIPQTGSVLIDEIFPATSVQWHQKIGYVPQTLYLLDDTVENNIAFGETTINQDTLILAIEAAQLTKFINKLPDGIKTMVGERGVRLSGGERQRIAIARALYRNPEILIFDEATSALDNETEEKLMETINKLSQDRTVIMIAHRLTTLKECDRILMMNKGCLERIVNYKDLIKSPKEEKTYA